VEERTDKGMDRKEKGKGDVEIASGEHCRLIGNVAHEL